jgi:hypothetical protein
VFVAKLGEPALPGVVAGEDDDFGLPGDKSTFNRNLLRIAISGFEELRNREARRSFNVVKKDNITVIEAIKPLSGIGRHAAPSVETELFIEPASFTGTGIPVPYIYFGYSSVDACFFRREVVFILFEES